MRTEIAVASGIAEDVAKKMYDERPCLDAKDVSDALIYALGTPGHVQVYLKCL